MADFIYSQPVKIWFGRGKLSMLSDVLNELNAEKCVLVCGKHFQVQAEELQKAEKRVCGIFSGVEQNPQLSGAIETADLAKSIQADTIIGIGGGSSIDTAKFAAAIAGEETDVLACYHGELPFPKTHLKIVAIPTTAGTGSEVTQVSVISHGSEKRTINNPVFMPCAAIIDPELSATVPPRTTMNTGLDALAHALEGYWSVNHQPIPDIMAAEAVRIVLQNLETAWREPGNMTARENMAYASLLGGLSFALPKTAACHACSYPLSEDYHLPHGEACAFTLDSFVLINADERLETLCKAVGLSGTEELAERIRSLKELAGLRTRLTQLGEVNLDKLCSDCAKHPLMNNNPVRMDEEKLHAMFEALA